VKRFSCGLVLAVLGLPAIAQAQTVDEFGAYRPPSTIRRESKQSAAVELRFGPYNPRVDSAFSHATPFRDTFGTDNRYLFGVEADWQILRLPHIGSLGPGFGWGYTRATAKARLTLNPSQFSAEDTSLSVMPLYAVAVFRADGPMRDSGIPLVPYAKLGLGAALWWASTGDNTSRENGVLGRGTSYGLQYALGLMLLLDPLDRQTAKDADNSLGLNHSYIFGEWYMSDLNGFSGSNRMNVGAHTWVLGLAMEF
jgi:hypothetical protein